MIALYVWLIPDGCCFCFDCCCCSGGGVGAGGVAGGGGNRFGSNSSRSMSQCQTSGISNVNNKSYKIVIVVVVVIIIIICQLCLNSLPILTIGAPCLQSSNMVLPHDRPRTPICMRRRSQDWIVSLLLRHNIIIEYSQ